MGWIIAYFLIGFIILGIAACIFDEKDFEDSNLGLACIIGWPIFILIMVGVIISTIIIFTMKEIIAFLAKKNFK